MDPPAPRHLPEAESFAGGERRGIFGGETEYAVLYLPDDSRETAVPPFNVIEEILFEGLLKGRKAAVSSGLKGGYFIENGGLVHLEVFLRTQADTPIIEAATPECRTPRDFLTYQRAFDHILTEVSVHSLAGLRRRGFNGRIAFGKNNRDARGVGYGCHENYLVHQETGLRDRLLLLLSAPLVLACLLPSALFLVVVLAGAILASAFQRRFPGAALALRRSFLRRFPRLKEHFRAWYFILMNAFLFAPIALYSLVLRLTAFRPFRQDLTSFLVTRQVLAGAGALDLEGGAYLIAQRPQLTSSLGEIVMFGRHKTMFDLKGLLYDPLALFRPERKLTITLGDSNLADHSVLLKVATTALVIEMIEQGVKFTDLRLRRPVEAFRAIARGGPWKELKVHPPGGAATPGRLTAVEIQREYLRRAKEHFSGRPEGRARHREVLDLWEEALEQLAETPGRLADRLDWAAKKSLLDRAVLAEGTWREFLAWGRILSRAPGPLLAEARSFEELLAKAGLFRRLKLRGRARRAVERGDITLGRFPWARDLFFQARKIDLRYHELGADPGYQRQLEREGVLRRLTSDEEVVRAARVPPQDTRARIRGYYIGLGESPESIRAGWEEVEIAGASRSILLPDPFQHRLPTD